ncbi:MAG TPA: DUF1003 domain-containing protein [Dehalococcoidia bacterium]|nr:DUF1003 domain-containing protein [Dehalococcoidia bacterium]
MTTAGSPRSLNVNQEHRDRLSPQQRLALTITNGVGTMWCVYAFALLPLFSLPATIKSHDPIIYVSWLSQAFLQLVLLPLLMVGQNLQGKHAELRAETDFEINQKAEQEVETILSRLKEIDERTLAIVESLAKQP